MPALPTIVGAFFGTLEGECNTLPYGNTFCFQSPEAADTPADAFAKALTIATSLVNQFGTHFMDKIALGYSGSTAKIYALQYPTLPAAEFTGANSGGLVADLAGVTVAAVVKHTVARRGRGSQSRSYLGPLTLTQLGVAQRETTSGTRTGFTTSWQAMIDGVVSDYDAAYSPQSIVYSQLSRIGAGATHPIVSSATELAVGYQRRRARRRDIA